MAFTVSPARQMARKALGNTARSMARFKPVQKLSPSHAGR